MPRKFDGKIRRMNGHFGNGYEAYFKSNDGLLYHATIGKGANGSGKWYFSVASSNNSDANLPSYYSIEQFNSEVEAFSAMNHFIKSKAKK